MEVPPAPSNSQQVMYFPRQPFRQPYHTDNLEDPHPPVGFPLFKAETSEWQSPSES
jgi:hypothetical protein